MHGTKNRLSARNAGRQPWGFRAFRASPWKSVGTTPGMPHGNLGVRRFISAFQSHVSFILGFAWHQEQASCPEELLFLATRTGKLPGGATFLSYKNRQAARRVVSTAPPACGWLRGTSRTSPGPPRRWRRPVRLQGTSARGRGFAAYLPGCARQPLQRPRCGLRQGGASLTTFGFVTTVPRYLPEASNSLTFVRGANPRLLCAA